jgi:hypothetical protein
MASSDPRIGFRLPWNSDRNNPRPATPGDSTAGPRLVPVEDLAPMEDAMETEETEVTLAREGTMTPNETLVGALAGPGFAYEVTSAIPMSDMTPEAAAVAEPSEPEALPAASSGIQPTEPEASAPQRPRPTKFLAGLTRAMQTAAEEARVATVSQYRSDAEAVVDQLVARTADQEGRLRTGADTDVASIHDWSQAEMERISRETEARIDARRAQLDDQVTRHAALMADAVDRVHARVANFENDMDVFFAELRDETDPSVFAARAEQIPEPPAFGSVDEAAIEAIFAEPPAGLADRVGGEPVPSAPEAVVEPEAEAEADVVEPEGEAVEAVVVEPEVEAQADVEPAAEAVTEPEAAEAVEAGFAAPEEPAWATMPSVPDLEAASVDTEASWEQPDLESPDLHTPTFEIPTFEMVEPVADEVGPAIAADLAFAAEPAEPEPYVPALDMPDTAVPVLPVGEREEAMARIQAAAIAAEVATADETSPIDADSRFGWSPTIVTDAPDIAETPGPEPEPAAHEEPAWIFQPRLEPHRAVAAETSPEPSETADAAIVGRLDGTAPPVEPAPSVPVQTQVVVSGLVSVASIASFKRQLGRLEGVSHVGVSSGPEGEFIFNVQHPETMSLSDLVPTLPGFDARVTGEGAGTLVVAAHDPEG